MRKIPQRYEIDGSNILFGDSRQLIKPYENGTYMKYKDMIPYLFLRELINVGEHEFCEKCIMKIWNSREEHFECRAFGKIPLKTDIEKLDEKRCEQCIKMLTFNKERSNNK